MGFLGFLPYPIFAAVMMIIVVIVEKVAPANKGWDKEDE